MVGFFNEGLNMAKESKKASDKFQLVEVVDLFTVAPGALMTGLSDDQYRRRKNRMKLVNGNKAKHSDGNVYKSEEGLQFKVGERLMIEFGDIDKGQRARLETVD